MNQAEALLKSLTEEVPIHDHVVTDQDSYFVINPDTRVIENASRTKNVLMQYDHNSEKFTFELARYVEGHDMTLCNRVRVHFNNVDGITNEENADVAELYDLAVCPDDESKVLCSWTITRQATQLVGTLNFLVQYECIDDAGNSVYEWHTDIYTDVEVKKGRNNAEQAVIEYSNILEQWYQRIFGGGTYSSDSSLLVVTFTVDESGKHIPSHTYDQIKEWLVNGGHAVLTDGKVWYNLATLSGSLVRFERVVVTENESFLVQYLITILGEMDKIETKHNSNNGGLHITDDENGNVTIESAGSVTITDDGNGNVTIV